MKSHHILSMKSMEIPENEPADSLTKLFDRDDTRFPPGLRLILTDQELETLELDKSCAFGDEIHIFAMARVCCISEHCITLQIESMAVEDEDTENEEEDAPEDAEARDSSRRNRRYGNQRSRYLKDA